MRWGSKGSLVLKIASGLWFDHEQNCGGDIIELIKVERGCSFGEALHYAGQFVSELRSRDAPTPRTFTRRDDSDNDDEQRIARALASWSEVQPLRGTLAEEYLRSRCIEVPDAALDVLGFHPACPWEQGRMPALVALVRDIITSEPIGIHRTALTDDARKLGSPKMMGLKKGGAIKLSGRVVTSELAIAEGVETALSATLLGFGPAWSVIDAGGLSKFPVLPGIERLTVAVDHDVKGAGQRAAAETKARWEAAGLRVRTIMSLTPGHDFNDVLRVRKGPMSVRP